MSLLDLHQERVRPLLDAVDKLRDILQGHEPIKLPSIVVVGDQSSGKSSVLENLSGIQLPRGQNIVTRCPLVLRMVCIQPNEQEKAEIQAEGQQALEIEFDDIENKINELTKQLAGTKQGISFATINLTVRKHACPDLTLIDLPGITRNPVGNQPKDIYNQIVSLIKKFIEPEESVILCVIPANIDFTTSEAIMLSREVDPAGVRTVGVVTKIDKCDQGIRAKLESRSDSDLKLALGYVAVRNRTQEEIDEGFTFEEARAKEELFFSTHSELSDMPAHYKGTAQLATKLTEIQIERIRINLPKVRDTIRERLREQHRELSSLPTELLSGVECANRFTEFVHAFVKRVTQLVTGEYDSFMQDDNMHVPALQHDIFFKFEELMRHRSPHFLTTNYQNTVIAAMKEVRGTALPNFLSAKLHSNLMAVELHRLKQPAGEVLCETRKCFDYVLATLCDQYFGIIPSLCESVNATIQGMMDKQETAANQGILEALKREFIADPFTLNHYYMDIIDKMKAKIVEAKGPTPTFESQLNDFRVDVRGLCVNGIEAQAAVEMQISVFAYWKVVHKRLSDTIALITRQYFNAFLIDDLASELQKQYRDTDHLLNLMRDTPAVIHKRQDLKASVKRLEAAVNVFAGL